MTGIASTTANLALWRLQWETLFSLPHLLDESEMDDEEGCRLTEIENFGENPGNLRMFQHVPEGLGPGAPLVVVLHGCTQTAAAYDRSSGWSWLAQEHGFAVLFAQQRGENNPRRCFNWFRPGDITRESGEAASIRHMVAFLADRHDLDRQRIFVTGLSAGGAMTNVMLAAYPDVFAAGAIIAGLPYRSATTVHDALQVMMEGVVRSPEAWGDEVRAASPLGALADSRIDTRWPRVAVWQGLADDVVRPTNGVEIVKQWTNVHGFGEQASEEEVDGTVKRMRWRNADGDVVIEAVAIEHLGHAVPIDAARLDLHEQPGVHFADIRLSSTFEIARFFGLLSGEADSAGKSDLDEVEGPETAVDQAAALAAGEKAGVAALSQALSVLPPALRGRRSRVRARDTVARARSQPPGLPPPVSAEEEASAASREREDSQLSPDGPVQAGDTKVETAQVESVPGAPPVNGAAAVPLADLAAPPSADRPPEVAVVEENKPAEAASRPPRAAEGAATGPSGRGILARIARLLGLAPRN